VLNNNPDSGVLIRLMSIPLFQDNFIILKLKVNKAAAANKDERKD
jgi:hypothetical protein